VELSAHESDEHRTRPVCSNRASGVAGAGALVLAVGSNGRVQTASDTCLTPEHQTLGVECLVVPAARPVPMSFAQ